MEVAQGKDDGAVLSLQHHISGQRHLGMASGFGMQFHKENVKKQ